MEKLYKKSLEHISLTLKSFDTYSPHSALIKAMEIAGIDNTTRSQILDKYDTAFVKEFQKVRDAQNWVDVIISDLDDKIKLIK